MGDQDSELLEIFLEEAADLIGSLSTILGDWGNDLNNLSKIADLKRDLHTLKGSARMMGQASVGTLAHEMETLSEALVKGQIPVERTVFDQIVLGMDHISIMIEAIRKKESPPAPDRILKGFHELLSTDEKNPVATPPSSDPEGTKAERPLVTETAKTGNTVAEVIRIRTTLVELLNTLSTENNMVRVGFEQHIVNFGCYVQELKHEFKRLDGQLNNLSSEIQNFIGSRELQARIEGMSDPLAQEIEQLSSLYQMSSVIKETTTDVASTLKGLNETHGMMGSLLLNQTRIGTELQHRLSDTRLVPFESIVPRLSRIARQVAMELKKQVDFKVMKSEGEMDRTVLEHLVPSLEHILRNALDHGIESIEERRRLGKPEKGKIEINFTRKGSVAEIEVKDDGAGINTHAVRKKAITVGLLAPDAIVSDEEVVRFIMEPGFSTREAVTEVSGRGVGMDVVNTAIKKMGGSLSILSESGIGSRMIIRFPFTTSLNRVLLFKIRHETFGVLLNSIEGVAGMPVETMEQLLKNKVSIFKNGGKSYHLHYLGSLLESQKQTLHLKKKQMVSVILVPSAEYPLALIVDSILYSRELLVQSLGTQFKLTNDYSGATLLGNGHAILIVDTNTLCTKAKVLKAEEKEVLEISKGRPIEALGKGLVMIIDDSISARSVTKRLLEHHHYRVMTAKDGLDGLQQLEVQIPDILLVDIDMPRMNGFEFASTVREDEKYKHIPIIVLTALASSVRRKQAKEMKLDAFIEKPFEEPQLLLTIQSLLGS
jgi:chemosensory pili system protein ChpA (sensor histidine kinase/response regulator)